MELDEKINTTKIKCSYLENEVENKDVIISKCKKFNRKKIFLYTLVILPFITLFGAIYAINFKMISIILLSLAGSEVILYSFALKKFSDAIKKEFGTFDIKSIYEEEEKEKRKLLQKYEHEHMKLEELIEIKRKINVVPNKIDNSPYIHVKNKKNIKVRKLVK